MANVKICDRCGALINPIDSGTHIMYGVGRFLTGLEESKDLCCSCMKKLKKFLKGEESGKEK